MNDVTALLNRKSISPSCLSEPAPSQEDLKKILSAAICAPDHGKLRPWEFIIIQDEQREKLGEYFAQALALRDPDAPQALIDKERKRPLRAPLIITVIAKITEGIEKIPPIEQVVSASCAAQNILNAAHMLGYGAILLTGKNAHDRYIHKKLGLYSPDEIIGFIYIGTITNMPKTLPRPDLDRFVEKAKF